MPQSLHALLTWSHHTYTLEIPSLEHSVSLTDEGGAPAMKPAAASYLGLLARNRLTEDVRPDDWRRTASRRDPDGRFVTPMRYAIELAPEGERAFLRALVPELYYPSEIAELYGIPAWAARFVMYAALGRLRERYERLMADQEKGTAAGVGWISKSDAQRAAEEAA